MLCHAFCRQFFGSYALSVGGHLTFSIESVDEALDKIRELVHRPSTTTIILAPEC